MASTRHRLGVVLLLDPPLSHEIQGLRRAVGDRSLARIAPHITLVSPVNVRSDQMDAALSLLRSAAGSTEGPFRIRLGPPASFLPSNPVLFLEVGGDLDALGRLRRQVHRPPLDRPAGWPWVPHVTLLDRDDPAAVAIAIGVLSGYQRETTVDRVVLLEERRQEEGRVWIPLADATLGPVPVVGRGGLALQLSVSRLIDPQSAALLPSDLPDGSVNGPNLVDGPNLADRPNLVVTGRREGHVVGLAQAWIDHDGGHVAVFVAADCRRQGIGSHLLAHVESAVRAAAWRCTQLRAAGPAAFYRARSDWSRAPE